SSPSGAPFDPPQSGPSHKTAQLQQQVNDVVGIMQQNATDLEQGAVQFRRGASGVRRQMWWKNMRWRLAIIVGVLIIIVIIV
ncbi:hypothetical protein BGX21_006874, partial [Mortierella sp. AD011]